MTFLHVTGTSRQPIKYYKIAVTPFYWYNLMKARRKAKQKL